MIVEAFLICFTIVFCIWLQKRCWHDYKDTQAWRGSRTEAGVKIGDYFIIRCSKCGRPKYFES